VEVTIVNSNGMFIVFRPSLWSGQRRTDFEESDTYKTICGCLFVLRQLGPLKIKKL